MSMQRTPQGNDAKAANAGNKKLTPQEIIAECDQRIKADQDDFEAYLKRGQAYCKLEKFVEAFTDFNFACGRASNGIQKSKALVCLGEIFLFHQLPFFGSNPLNMASETFSKAIGADDKNADAWTYQGLVFYRQKNYPKAIESLNEAVRLNVQHEQAHLYRGQAANQQKKHFEALSEFYRVLEINPINQTAHSERCAVLQEVFHYPQKWLFLFALDPKKWSADPKHSVFTLNSKSFLEDDIPHSDALKTQTLYAIKESLSGIEKVEALAQSLIPRTVLGNLFYARRRAVSAPSLTKGRLQEIALQLNREICEETAKQLRNETLEGLLANTELAQHFGPLYRLIKKAYDSIKPKAEASDDAKSSPPLEVKASKDTAPFIKTRTKLSLPMLY